MANPKRKVSRSKRDKRRANWLGRLSTPGFSECPNCGEPKLSHHACLNCGYYKGQQIVVVEE